MGVDQLIFILLIIFALFSVFATNLKHAIISSGVLGLWVSLVYVLYHAPDVAIAEAVIASSLGVTLYIITIKRYKDITVERKPRLFLKVKLSYLLLIGSCGLVIYLSRTFPEFGIAPLATLVMESTFSRGGGLNPVGSIYLNYRVFDTIFEALMLLISGVGVIHLIRYQGGTSHEQTKESSNSN